MMRQAKILGPALLALVLLSAMTAAPLLAADPPAEQATEKGDQEAGGQKVAEDTPEETVDPELEKLVEAAIADLAEQLEADAAQIETVSGRKVVWRDGSLGCPKPDMMYTQALQDGALIELRLDEKLYRYHSNLQGPPFLCEKPAANDPLPPEE